MESGPRYPASQSGRRVNSEGNRGQYRNWNKTHNNQSRSCSNVNSERQPAQGGRWQDVRVDTKDSRRSHNLTSRLDRVKIHDDNTHVQPIEIHIPASTRKVFTQTVAEYLMCLAQTDGDKKAASKRFLTKMVDSDPEPEVKFFLRDEKNELVCLDNLLRTFNCPGVSFDDSAKSNSGEKFVARPKLENVRGDFPALCKTTEIQPFPLPSDGKPFNGFVSTIHDPSHFIIQPLKYRDELKEMNEAMNKFYSINKPKIDIGKIKKGKLFACQNEQGKWIRALLISVNEEETGEVSLRSVDYGNSITVNFRDMYNLAPQFHKLPILAQKAELAGISPIKMYWTLQDCLRFNELSAKKVMYCVLVEALPDVISILMFDTSSNPPVDVGDQLVKEGRAVDITTSK